MNYLLQEREPSLQDFEREESRREARDDDDDDEGTHNDENNNNAVPDVAPAPKAPSMRYRGNTGVKSVLADYAEHKEMQRIEAEIKQMKLEWAIKKQSVTARTAREEELERQRQQEEEEQNTEEKDDIDKLLEDDDFFEQYKNQKIQEIKSTKAKTYGFLGTVTRDTFLEAVENEPVNVFVVIHVYQDWIKPCTALNKILQELAVEYPYVKFLRMPANDALSQVDDIALPILMVYQAGELYNSFVRLTDVVGHTFDLDHVEKFLASQGILPRKLSATYV